MAPQPTKEKAPKKVNLLDDSDSDDEDGGADIAAPQLKVNEEYAKRFEHNKKREEMHRLEEKFKKTGKRDDDSDDDSSSSDETEDEEGFLATEDLDAQISATLSAIKNKDPRMRDKDFSFFKETPAAVEPTPSKKKEKPLFLKDYHREKILAGGVAESDDEDDAPPKTYVQEQDALKKSIISEINKAAESDEEEDEFVKRKPGQEKPDLGADGVHPARAGKVSAGGKKKAITEEDIANADKDPELFLSNFMAARAWTEGGEHNWKAFDSDEGEDEGDLADKFEEAYNLRFEDPEKSNQALKTYSREIVNARTVRKEATTSRKRQRELEKERKEEEKRQRKEEKARLRKLKLEEAEEKLKKIKQAAGLSGKELNEDEWLQFLNDAWEDDKWEDEMKRRFGEQYYAEVEDGDDSDDGDEGGDEDDKKKKRRRPKKPTWDDDIDIKDIVPDFKDDDEHPQITLSDDEGAAGNDDNEGADDDEDDDGRPSKKRKTSKDIKKERLASKKAAKAERAKLEALVDAKMDLDVPASSSSSSKTPEMFGFRYRETSPQSFGLTARDILLAPSDAALNEFAGLKKLATFRDQEKKRKDKKRLGKKARLRSWRREHFGAEFERTGPTFDFEGATFKDAKKKKSKNPSSSEAQEENAEDGGAKLDGEAAGKKRKRSRGKKKAESAAEE